MLNNPANLYLWRALALFLMVGAVLGVLLGALLIFKPHYVEQLNRVANRWVSVRRVNQWLDRTISLERWFYRHHRAAGIAIMLGAAYVFIHFGFQFDKTYTLHQLSGKIPAKLLDALLDALVLFLLLGSAIALMLGLLICLRPSLLRGLEQKSNQWVSLRQATKIFDVQRGQVDEFVLHHTRRVGWALLFGSLYLGIITFRLLL